jgi:hypothetical protein
MVAVPRNRTPFTVHPFFFVVCFAACRDLTAVITPARTKEIEI